MGNSKNFTMPNDLLWSILGELSCPEIDGDLTKERALKYIQELKKL